MKTDNVLLDKSKVFAIRIIRLYQHLCNEKNEYVISKQILRSGTSIGANAREACRAQGTKDFIYKLYISLKEADETAYWLELLVETNYISKSEFDSMHADSEELLKLLTSIIKSVKENNSKF